MPCSVSGCSGSSRLEQFPADKLLRRRWCDAVAVATGTGLNADEELLELCEDHFEQSPMSAERYQEPTRFTDRNGHPVELGSCRLCHRIEIASQFYSLDGPTADVAIGTMLEDSVKVQFSGDDFLRLICGECLAQVGMVLTIQKSFLIKCDPSGENRSDPCMEVTSCRLCYRSVPTAQMCFLDDTLADDVTIGSVLNNQSTKVLASETDCMQLICLECLARIDLMRSIQTVFVEKDEEFRSWQLEFDQDCHPELLLEVKVEPVEVQEPVKKRKTRKPKKEDGPKVKTYEAQCEICCQTFSKAHSLAFHMLIHTGELPHKCTQCDASFRMSTDLSKHVLGVHEGKTPYDCKQCNIPIATKTEYYRHRKMAHSTGYKRVAILYRCLICKTSCLNVGEIRNHITAHHEEGYPFLECPECPTLQLTCAAHLKVHNYHKHPQNEAGESFICPTCGKEFDKKMLLQKHIRVVHPEPNTEKSYPCPDCGKVFRLYSTYHQHKRIHSGVRKYACKHCEKTFTQPSGLKFHIRGVHTLEKPYTCPDCGDSFKDSRTFKSHCVKYHSQGAGKFECPTCRQEFPAKSVLSQHVRAAHEDPKHYGCLDCSKVFVAFAGLKRHRAKCRPQVKVKTEPTDPLSF